MRKLLDTRNSPSFKVRIWDFLPLETQLFLIQQDLVDRDVILVDTDAPKIPRLLLMETREELERIMREKPRYCIFQPSLRGLRSLKVEKEK